MPVDILLDIPKKRSFSFGLHIDAGNVVRIENALHSLLDDQLILLMSQFSDLQLLLALRIDDSFQKLLFFLERAIEVLDLFVIVLFQVVDLFFGLSAEVDIDMLVKLRLIHLADDAHQFIH